MNAEARIAKHKAALTFSGAWNQHFELRHLSLIRHSTFVIRDFVTFRHCLSPLFPAI
jgi:hypothetical protein